MVESVMGRVCLARKGSSVTETLLGPRAQPQTVRLYADADIDMLLELAVADWAIRELRNNRHTMNYGEFSDQLGQWEARHRAALTRVTQANG